MPVFKRSLDAKPDEYWRFEKCGSNYIQINSRKEYDPFFAFYLSLSRKSVVTDFLQISGA